jgi:hypothetical protein
MVAAAGAPVDRRAAPGHGGVDARAAPARLGEGLRSRSHFAEEAALKIG